METSQLPVENAPSAKFVEWWHNVGSGMRPEVHAGREDDHEAHAQRVAAAAWSASTTNQISPDEASHRLLDLLREAREALNKSSCYWQAVAAHYGKTNPTNAAEEKSLAIRDGAISKIDAYLTPSNKISAAPSAAPAEPQPATLICPKGRVEVTGTILSTKITEDKGYGVGRKMLVELKSGARIFGSAPLGVGADQGNTITMKATIEPSLRDPSFGIFSRPQIISTCRPASQPEPVATEQAHWYQKV